MDDVAKTQQGVGFGVEMGAGNVAIGVGAA
jgi:hypothetical protein